MQVTDYIICLVKLQTVDIHDQTVTQIGITYNWEILTCLNYYW